MEVRVASIKYKLLGMEFLLNSIYSWKNVQVRGHQVYLRSCLF
jgi:hypothetical protein